MKPLLGKSLLLMKSFRKYFCIFEFCPVQLMFWLNMIFHFISSFSSLFVLLTRKKRFHSGFPGKKHCTYHSVNVFHFELDLSWKQHKQPFPIIAAIIKNLRHSKDYPHFKWTRNEKKEDRTELKLRACNCEWLSKNNLIIKAKRERINHTHTHTHMSTKILNNVFSL